MANTQSVTPIQYAVSLTGAHPELSTPVSSVAATVTSYIQNQTNSLNQLATVISSQGPASTSSGWAQAIKVGELNNQPIYQYNVSAQTLSAASGLIQNTLVEVKQDLQLQDVLWSTPESVTGTYQPVVPPVEGFLWTADQFPPQHGITVQSVSANSQTQQMQILLQNAYPFQSTVYVEFLDEMGTALVPDAWTSPLPGAVAADFETATMKFLGLLQPTLTQAGIPMTVNQVGFSCTAPVSAKTLRFTFGSLGNSGEWNPVINALALLVTGVVGYAVPWMLTASGTYSSPQWYNQLVADTDIIEEVISAGGFLAATQSLTEALQLLHDNIGKLLFGGALPNLLKKLQSVIDSPALIAAAQGINWPLSTLLATNQAGVSTGVVETLAVPVAFSMAFSWEMIAQRTVELLPDPVHGGWPVAAQTCELHWSCGAASGTLTTEMKGLLTAFPISCTLTDFLPADLALQLNVQVLDAKQAILAQTTIENTWANPIQATISERVPTLDGQSTYQPVLQLAYDSDSGYSWESAEPNSGTIANLDCSNVGRSLCELTAISFNPQAQSLAYSWRASGQVVPPKGSQAVSSQQLYLPQAISIGSSPQAALQTSDCGYLQRTLIACGLDSEADNLFMDTSTSTTYLRPVTLGESGTFDVAIGKSRGCLTMTSTQDLALTPNGCAGAISTSNQVLQIVRLSESAVADAEAPQPFTVGGAGTRVGLLSMPVGVAATPDEHFVVLEASNRRLQAFDTFGNPAPYFSGAPVLSLSRDPSTHFLDVEVDAYGNIYVLYSQGDTSQVSSYRVDVYDPSGKKVSTTTGVNGARIAVDLWRNLYTLDYTLLEGPGGAPIPSIRVWSPLAITS